LSLVIRGTPHPIGTDLVYWPLATTGIVASDTAKRLKTRRSLRKRSKDRPVESRAAFGRTKGENQCGHAEHVRPKGTQDIFNRKACSRKTFRVEGINACLQRHGSKESNTSRGGKRRKRIPTVNAQKSYQKWTVFRLERPGRETDHPPETKPVEALWKRKGLSKRGNGGSASRKGRTTISPRLLLQENNLKRKPDSRVWETSTSVPRIVEGRRLANGGEVLCPGGARNRRAVPGASSEKKKKIGINLAEMLSFHRKKTSEFRRVLREWSASLFNIRLEPHSPSDPLTQKKKNNNNGLLEEIIESQGKISGSFLGVKHLPF